MSDVEKAGGGQGPGDPPPINPFGKFDVNLFSDALSAVCKRIIEYGGSNQHDVDFALGCLPYLPIADELGDGLCQISITFAEEEREDMEAAILRALDDFERAKDAE